MGRTYAGILGPLAFATILARSLIDGGGSVETLSTALACLFGFAAIGYVAGQIAESIVWEAVRARFNKEMATREQAAEADGST